MTNDNSLIVEVPRNELVTYKYSHQLLTKLTDIYKEIPQLIAIPDIALLALAMHHPSMVKDEGMKEYILRWAEIQSEIANCIAD